MKGGCVSAVGNINEWLIDCGINCSQLLHSSLFGAGFFTHRNFLCHSIFLCLFLSLMTFLFSFPCCLPDLFHKFIFELEKARNIHLSAIESAGEKPFREGLRLVGTSAAQLVQPLLKQGHLEMGAQDQITFE